jgi:probable F420-dependent oxidoreductase
MSAFRFGINFLTPMPRTEWRGTCRRAESLGYDVLLVPDHLGVPAPFPALVSAAEATQRPQVGTFVLNVGFWNPTLLAREAATTDLLTDGRLELGLGTGYVKAEFDAAGLPWEGPGEKVDRLEHTVKEVSRLLSDPDHQPGPAVSPPPILVGGMGDRVLRLAAERADIVGFTGAQTTREGTLTLADASVIAERTAFLERHARGRKVEKNILVQMVIVTSDRRAAARRLQSQVPHLSVEQILDLPTLLLGTHREIAAQLHENRERYGFTYITVLEPAMDAFAPIIDELR